MTKIKIPQTTARQLACFAQGLHDLPERQAQKEDVKSIISNLSILQIDTINIVARSPYFWLWSRLGEYDPVWLNELLAEKQIFEYWAHAASLMPIEDYPLHRRLMLENKRLPGFEHWFRAHPADCEAVMQYIKTNGEVRSSDFVRKDGIRGTWWDWKVEKRALEYWFAAGELMVVRRVNFQRVYDLRERVLPSWDDKDAPDLSSVMRTLLIKSIRSLGFALPTWLADYFRLSKTETQSALKELLEEKTLMELEVDGWNESCWALPEVWEAFLQQQPATLTTLLTPFDSLIWDRKRTSQLFNFDFSIECYLPAPKRRYGYFLLPILHKGELVARVDAKAHRASGKFEIIHFYLEDKVSPDQQLAKEIAEAIQRCAAWHKTPEVLLTHCEPESFGKLLSANF